MAVAMATGAMPIPIRWRVFADALESSDFRIRVRATNAWPEISSHMTLIRYSPRTTDQTITNTMTRMQADSTMLLARAHRPGELYRLAVAVPEHSVTLESWSHRPDGTVLHLVWPHDSAEVLAIGLDQAE